MMSTLYIAVAFLVCTATAADIDLVLSAVLHDTVTFLAELAVIVSCATSRLSLSEMRTELGRTYAVLGITSGTPTDTSIANNIIELAHQGHLSIINIERATLVVTAATNIWLWVGLSVGIAFILIVGVVLYVRWRRRQESKAQEEQKMKDVEEKFLGPKAKEKFQQAADERARSAATAREAMGTVKQRIDAVQQRNKELLEILSKARQLERDVQLLGKGNRDCVESSPRSLMNKPMVKPSDTQDTLLDFELHTDHEDSQLRWWHRGYDEAKNKITPNYQHTETAEQVHQLISADIQKEDAGIERGAGGIFRSANFEGAMRRAHWWQETKLPQLETAIRCLLEIRPSPFHGGGVFSRDFMPANLLIFSYVQPCHFKNESLFHTKLEMDMRFGIAWWIRLHFYAANPERDEYVVTEDPVTRGWGCLLNSSRGTKAQPNCELIWPDRVPWVRTIRPILPSTELLLDYSY